MERNLYRGKSLSNGDWVFGGIFNGIYTSGRVYIIGDEFKMIEVDPKTVGQFTGSYDGGEEPKKIFEHDIVLAKSQGSIAKFEIRWRQEATPCWILFPAWQNQEFWYLHCLKNRDGQWEDCHSEVIGNIFDNPELVKW